MAGVVNTTALHHHEEALLGIFHHIIYGSLGNLGQAQITLLTVYSICKRVVTLGLLVKKNDFIGRCSLLLILVITSYHSVTGLLSLCVVALVTAVT